MAFLDYAPNQAARRNAAQLGQVQTALGVPQPNQPFFGDYEASGAKKDFLGSALDKYGAAAYAGKAEEEQRGQDKEDYLKAEKAAADKPTITQEEIDRKFGREASQAGRTMLDSMSALREYMGQSGVYGGGLPAGIGANFELQRLGQLTQARGDLMSFKATQDALDRQKQFDRAQVVGAAIDRPISMLGIDFENQSAQLQLAKYGIDKQAKAAKQQHSDNLFGDILKGATGLLGAFV